jgi:putative ABC transport system permease protein
MQLWNIAGRNLWRRPARSVLTVVGLTIAVTAVVALVGVAESLEGSFLDLYRQRGVDLVVQPRGGSVQLTKGINLSFGDRIRKLAGVKEVVGGLMDMVAFEDYDLMMVIVNGWEPDCPVLDRVRVVSGRRLQAGDERLVMLGRILAANLGKKVGDRLKIYGREFEVVGIFESFSVYENGAAFMLLDELQKQMDRPGQVTGFVVHATDKSSAAVAEIRRQINAMDPQIVATPCEEFVSSISQMKVARTMSWTTSIFAIVIGAIGVLNTIAMSVFERRGEIASLRAMGWRKHRVMQLILDEALCLSLLGSLFGVAIGTGVIVLLTHLKVTSGLVQGDISIRAILEGIAVAVAIALIGAAYPAYRSASQPIADALRGV